MVLNSLYFCLPGKLLISPSNLNESLARWSILVHRFFSFITWNISCYSLLACRASVEKSANNLMGCPLPLFVFVLLLLLIVYLCCLIFVSSITMYLGVFLLRFILPGTFLCFLDMVDYFLSHVGGSFQLLPLEIRSQVLSLSLLLMGSL